MNDNRARKIFIFDMADFNNMRFLDNHGNLRKNFTSDCIFYYSKEALATLDKAEEKYPKSNFQLELLPSNIRFFPCKNEDFWHLFGITRNRYYGSLKND